MVTIIYKFFIKTYLIGTNKENTLKVNRMIEAMNTRNKTGLNPYLNQHFLKLL